MKGAVDAITLIEAFITTLLIITSTTSFSNALNDEFKEKMTDIQVQRIDNAALALSSTPNSSIELDMEGYTVSYQDTEINISYQESSSTIPFESGKYGYEGISAPSDPVTINSTHQGTLCLKREATRDSDSYSPGRINPRSGLAVSFNYILALEPGECS